MFFVLLLCVGSLSIQTIAAGIDSNSASVLSDSTYKGAKRFRIEALSLSDYPEFRVNIDSLFRFPRIRLKEDISAENWFSSEQYSRFFSRYDDDYLENKKSRNNKKNEALAKVEGVEVGSITVKENYNVPLPASIDIEIDLTGEIKTLKILGIEFNFEKLNSDFQRDILNFTGDKKKGGARIDN